MKYQIKNGAHRGKAFKVHGGLEVVKPGATRVLKLSQEFTASQIAAFLKDGVSIKPSKAKPENGATGGNNTLDKPKVKTKKRQGLEANAEKAGVPFDDETSDDELATAIKAAKASA